MKKIFLPVGYSPRSHKRSEGDHFEGEARQYLENRGYRVLAANVLYSFGEIDLVAEAESPELTLVFIEVRKRDPRSWIRPEETLTYPKQRRLKNAIEVYLAAYRGRAQSVRIDLMACDGRAVRHYPDFMRL